MATLLIDNHDSFTFNLFHLLAAVEGREPVVVRNNEAQWAQLRRERFERCVISPGAGRPDRPRDFGLSAAALAEPELPVLGICLGHQGLALSAGGEVGRVPPMHGRRSPIHHDGSELFDGIPQGFLAVRYHSLAVREPLPAALAAIARAADGTVMALRHRQRPHWGVQFHPESIESEWGERLIGNFIAAAARRRAAHGPARTTAGSQTAPRRRARGLARGRGSGGGRLELALRSVSRPVDAETAFVGLFGSEPNAFWLDSSRAGTGGGRFSFMGAGGGPLSALVSHDVAAGELTVTRRGGRERVRSGLLDWLDRTLAEPGAVDSSLPFEFAGGWVGYLGYELKAECGARLVQRSPLPDAQLLFADRLVAYDHLAGEAHALCLTQRAVGRDASREWLEHTARRLRMLRVPPEPRPRERGGTTTFALARPAAGYLADIDACQELLAAGESYEICLTNELRGPRCGDALALYRVLRRVNPAPFAAFLRLGGVEVIGSSPERFLTLDRRGGLEAKPIKGTVARRADPGADAAAAQRLRTGVKDRAENLMIVDVLRNDLGRVAEVGSVHVPSLMSVESYETVHQLVSTVRARLRPEATIADCLRAAFPGGSMTGAPKLRTMELIDRLEGRPRGVYSGAIGYLASTGAADLSIAIRTIVNSPLGMSIGAGGAITVQSDARAELRELLLKARAPLDAVGLALHGRRDAAVLAPAARRRRTVTPARGRAGRVGEPVGGRAGSS
jgi:para-aminobenzoate synthetase